MRFKVSLGETPDWPRAAVSSRALHHIFQTRDYLETWRSTIGAARGAALFYTTVEDGEGPLLLAPLCIERRRGVRILSFPDGGVADYNAPILIPRAQALKREDMEAIWKQIVALAPPADAIILDKMPDTIAGTDNPFRYLGTGDAGTSGYVAHLEHDWEAFRRGRLHRAKDSARKRRRLAELGEVRFVVAETQADAQRLLDAMIAQKTAHYLQSRGEDSFDRPGFRTYFKAMTDRFFAEGIAHLSALEIDGKVVAAHWGLCTRERFYCLMLSYDHEHAGAKYSPGRLLVEDLMAWSCARGIRAFDFGYGDAPWKDFLCDERISMTRHVSARTLAGRLYIEAAGLARTLRAAGTLKRRPGPAARPALSGS